MTPYHDQSRANGFERTFVHWVEPSELVWHKDRNNRIVHVLEGEGWQLQMDNSMPYLLKPNDVIRIPRDTFHRLWKGSGDLKLLIIEEQP